jgi:glycosyltransferase involved in cell wall biosynthesis
MSVSIEEQEIVETTNSSSLAVSTHLRPAVVSVVIPAYNSASFISETIESVLSQTYKDYEIIVVNDGSPDTENLEKVLAAYKQKIVYLKQENRGPSAARNSGIRIAKGEFIAFLDSDDIWLEEFLEEQIKFLQSQSQYEFVYSDAHLFGDVHKVGNRFMERNPSVGNVTLESLLALRCNVITSGVVVKRQKLLDVGLFDEEHGHRSEDFDLWIRLAKNGVRFAYQNKPLLRYRYRKDSLSSDRGKLHDGALKALEKLEAAGGLSGEELSALKTTRRKLTAYKYLSCGKQHLARGEYTDAAKKFALSREYESNWKLGLVLFGLRLSPSLTKRIYLLVMQD